MFYVYQPIVLQGYTKLLKGRKKTYQRELIQLCTEISFFVEDAKNVPKVAELEIKKLKKRKEGWGKDFEGWHVAIFGEYSHSEKTIIAKEPCIEAVENWKMEKAMKMMTAEELALFLTSMIFKNVISEMRG